MDLSTRQKFVEHRHSSHINRMRTQLDSYSTDSSKEDREKEHKCKYCYYIETGMVSMSVMTNFDCINCGKTMMFASSNTDVLCEECAIKLNLCKHCGANIMEGYE